jgi:hypothetical protein
MYVPAIVGSLDLYPIKTSCKLPLALRRPGYLLREARSFASPPCGWSALSERHKYNVTKSSRSYKKRASAIWHILSIPHRLDLATLLAKRRKDWDTPSKDIPARSVSYSYSSSLKARAASCRLQRTCS